MVTILHVAKQLRDYAVVGLNKLIQIAKTQYYTLLTLLTLEISESINQ